MLTLIFLLSELSIVGFSYLFLYKALQPPEQFVTHAEGIALEAEVPAHLQGAEVRA